MNSDNLTIRGAKNEIIKRENQIEYLKEKKCINFEKTQVKSLAYKDIAIIASGTSDKFAHFIIQDEAIDKQIITLEREIMNYNTFILKEIERMRKYDEIALISFLRDEGKQWREIDQKLHRADGYSRLKYSRYKKANQGDSNE